MNVLEEKDKVRKEIIRRLRDQEASLRDSRSAVIQKKLLSSEEFRVAKVVMTYVSLPTEVDTYTIIKEAMKQGKRVAVPYMEPASKTIIASELATIKDLEKGPFGIYQTKKGLEKRVPLREIDLIVVPAIAYDKENMRLGRGKGYYDKFLACEDLSSVETIGLAFRFQVVECLPHGPHDKSVHKVLTD